MSELAKSGLSKQAKSFSNNENGFKNDQLLALEPRIVFDGALVATAAVQASPADDPATDGNSDGQHSTAVANDENIRATDAESIALVFIDLSLEDAQTLAQGVDQNAHIIWLDPAKDGVAQIGEALSSYENVSSMHLFTHAQDGALNLGNTLITAGTVAENSDGLKAWSKNLTADADILFYGCNFAETAQGQNLLESLATLTSADIAASTDLTGAASQGGDWNLEYSTGDIEAKIALSEAVQSEYAHTLAAVPNASLSDVGEVLIGETMNFTVTFDNSTGSDTGYAPYINLLIPYMGNDGAYDANTDTYTDTPDGISFTSATFLGQTVQADEYTLVDTSDAIAGIQIEHPLAKNPDGTPLIVTIEDSLGFQEGDKLVILTLPFGSFTTGQPAVDIQITAEMSNLADIGVPLSIVANGGFALGDTDALDNFDTDPPVQATSLNAGNSSATSATPQIVNINTTYSGSEGETATGENFEVGHTISLEVAGGQTLDNVSIDYTLAEETVFTSATANGGSISASPEQNLAGNTADDLLTASYASISGSQDTTVRFYVNEFDQTGSEVINPTTGSSNGIVRNDNISVSGFWNPIDVRDGTNVPITGTFTAPAFVAKSLAVQKHVSNTTDNQTSPGDILEYTINFQISDYFAFDDLQIEDIFSDGQNLHNTPITLDINHQGVTLTQQVFTLDTDYTLTENTGSDYSETLDFDLSALLTSSFASGILEGGKFSIDDAGGTTGTIIYQTVIQDTFADPARAPNDYLKQGDGLTSNVTVEGRNLDAGLSPFAGPQIVADVSSAGVAIANSALEISVYAIKGSSGGDLESIQPADDVTFRLEFDLLTGDFEDFVTTAYLPLPIFDVSDLDADGSGGDVFAEDTINSVPDVGKFRFGPEVSALVGGITINPGSDIAQNTTANSIAFSLGDLDDPNNNGGKIDILFTIKASAAPFADGLFLTTQGQQSDVNTSGDASLSNATTQLQLQEPKIEKIIKGIVATNVTGASVYTPGFTNGNPSNIKAAGNGDANPLSGAVTSANLDTLNLDNDVTDVDAGDLVRFAIIVENTGSGSNGAFDITISEDDIPAGFKIPAGGINMLAVNGAGSALSIDTPNPATALFTAGGITLSDGATGVLASGSSIDGSNIAIITYDLEVDVLAEALGEITSEARLVNYSNIDGGDDFTPVDLADDATTTIAGAKIEKTFISGNEGTSTSTDVVVGEVVTYQTVITIPEGTSDLASFRDTLDTGLAFLDASNVTITTTPGIALDSSTISFSSPGAAAENENRRMNIDFGTITNSDTDNTTAQTITITYKAVVLNTDANDAGDTFDETARYTSEHEGNLTASADNLTLREPAVSVAVTPDNANTDASDIITWTVVVSAAPGTAADAHDINLQDIIPSGVTYIPGSLTDTAGVVPTSLSEAGGTISANWTALTPGQRSTFTFQTSVDASVSLGQEINNQANINWSSLPGTSNGDIAGNQSAFDAERDGSDGENGTPDNYAAHGTGSISILFDTPTLVVDETSEASNGSDAAVGEIVRYRFVVRVPESTTSDFRVEPEIPAGMQFLNDGTATIAFVSDGGLASDSPTLTGGSLDITGNETTVLSDEPDFVLDAGNISGGPFGSGDNPEFLLGEISNVDNDANQEFIIIEYNAIVLNEAGVDNGDALDSVADVKSGAGVLTTTNSATVEVAEPQITNLSKSVIDTDGSTATFQITFENYSGTDAFNVNLADSLPANLVNLSNISITPAGGTLLDANNSNASGLDIDLTTMPDGGSITITYTADIVDSTSSVTSSNADVTWTSVPGDGSSLGASSAGVAGSSTGERTGNGTGQNDYVISDGAGLNVINGTLFEDSNRDGIVDGTDPKLANTDIIITYLGTDNNLGGGDDIVLTTRTDPNGNFSVGGLPAGQYQIRVDDSSGANSLPAGYLSINDATGSETDNLIELTLGEGVTSDANNFGVLSPNSAPNFTNYGGSNPDVTHIEGNGPTVLDADGLVGDPELGANALDDWDGATLKLERNGGADALDSFVGTGTLATLTEGGNINLNGANVGIVSTNSNGTLVLTFGNDATTAQVNEVLQQIGYEFIGDAPPSNITIQSTINDKNTANAQGTGSELTAVSSIIVAITNVNDLPTSADNTLTITEDTSHTFAIAEFAFNDVDNPDSFQQLRIDTLPSSGTLFLNGSPITVGGTVISAADIADLVYTPDEHGNGSGFDAFNFSVGDNFGGFDATPNTMTFNVDPVNDAPVFMDLGGSNPDIPHVEGGGLTALDPDATIVDVELDAADNWNNATLSIARSTGANGQDFFNSVGPDLASIAQGQPITVSGTPIGTVTTNSGGTLVLTFNANATSALVNQAFQQIGYEFNGDAPPADISIAYVINDGNTGDQGTGGALSDNSGIVNVRITATNDAPTGADNILNLNEDEPYSFALSDFGFTDSDVTDSFANLRIDSVPANGELQLNGVTVTDGQIIAAADIGNLVFVATTHESGNNYTNFTFSVGDQSGQPNAFDASPNTMVINIAPISDGPTIDTTDALAFSGQETELDVAIALIDVDGSEILSNTITIDNVPDGLDLFGAGGVPINVIAGTATLTIADLTDLKVLASPTLQGIFELDINASSIDGTAAEGFSSQTLVLDIRDPSGPPILTPTTGAVPGGGTSISFGAPGSSLGDADGDGISDVYNDDNAVKANLSIGDDEFRKIARIDIYLTGNIDDQLMLENKSNTIRLPGEIFRHADPNEKFTYKVEMADGSALPPWLEFNPDELLFEGIPPIGSPASLEFVIIATDSKDNKAKAEFRIVISRDVDAVKQPPEDQRAADVSNEEELAKSQQDEDAHEAPEEPELKDEASLGQHQRATFEQQVAATGRIATFQQDQAFLASLSS